MALKLQTKTKVAEVVKPKPKSKLEQIALKVEEVGSLQKNAAKIAEKIKALQVELEPYSTAVKQLEELANEYLNDKNPDEEFTLNGTHYRAVVGKKGNKREITDLEYIRKRVGPKVFMEIASVKLSDVDNYLTPDEKAKCVKTERTKRNIKVEPKNVNV